MADQPKIDYRKLIENRISEKLSAAGLDPQKCNVSVGYDGMNVDTPDTRTDITFWSFDDFLDWLNND